MKTTKLIVAVMAAITIFSCSKGNDGGEQNLSKVVTVRITSAQSGKAIKDQVADGYKTPVNNAWVFFLDANDNVVKGGGYITGKVSERFTGVDSKSKKVFVVANTKYNTSSDLFEGLATIAPGSTKAQIEALASVSGGIQYEMDATSKGLDNTTLAGVSTTDFVVVTGQDSEYTASVTISPVVSRIEIVKISSTGDITTFNLDGIYIDNYYSEFTIGALQSGTSYSVLQDQANLVNVIACMKDESIGTGGTSYVPAGTNTAWAYMVPVTGVDPVNGQVKPRVVVKISNPNISGTVAAKTQFITVTDYKDANGNPVTFSRGEIYRISNLQFSSSNITDEPNTKNLNVTVTVDVLGWHVSEVAPVV